MIEEESGNTRLFRSFGEWDLFQAITVRNKEVIILLSQELPFSNILQVAKAVVSESPQSGEEKGMAMEDLDSLLAQNPFLTRKEIPRTPENLCKSTTLFL